MAVYQQYGTGTETETKKKRDDDGVGVGVGTKNTKPNTNTNRSSSVALMSTLVAVVLVVIVMMSVQASSSSTAAGAAGALSVALSAVAFEEANLLRTGTGTNIVVDYPPKMGALLSSFTQSNRCVEWSTGEDVPWKNACMCLVDSVCYSKFKTCTACWSQERASDCQLRAAEIFSSCDKDEKDFDDEEYVNCVSNFHHSHYISVDALVDCVVEHNHLRICFGDHPILPSRT